ncbi:MBT domain-containing protein 1-like isoform X2 [Lineus longissimus]|uniref:MBT domain-containing protein 1-like isoform X2 n=1 Tax=Lineus longissimus TaxID=88925 RepID=UPI00315DDF54
MEQDQASDWGSWPLTDQTNEIDAMVDAYHEQQDCDEPIPEPNNSSLEGKEDSLYEESSALAGEDDFVNDYAMYDGYDSYNDSGSGGARSDDDSGQGYSEEDQLVDKKGVIKSGSSVYFYPTGKEGMATCENCGTIGIKHAFYSKSKKFCSLPCSREYGEKFPQSQQKRTVNKQDQSKKKSRPKGNHVQNVNQEPASFDWSNYLTDTDADAASVSCFKHVAMTDAWENITVGMKVEVLNSDCDIPNNAYWIAAVLKIAGYKAMLRYEGFGQDSCRDFWVNLCTNSVHPVGWCATIGKPLVPPKTIQHKYSDWKDFLVKRLTGARTVPNNFYSKVLENLNNGQLKKGMFVEVVDKMCVSAMRVATVDEVHGGRLRLKYTDSLMVNDDFWVHERSPLVHHVGWSQMVGHKLHASAEYKNRSLKKIALKNYADDDSRPDMFPKLKDPPEGIRFEVGMKLEAIDPLNLSSICVATVMKVLRNNYLMIGIDGSMAANGSDWFCYHASSPCIFPVGFCEINNIELSPPKGYRTPPFKWFDYLKQTKSVAAPVKLFDKVIPKHGYKVGMKLEAVDLMEPRLLCVGAVGRVVGRLLRIHFDGWETEYDQWVDCQSPDIYPVGWCEMVGYNLEGPRHDYVAALAASQPKRKKPKTQVYRGPRKKRKPKTPPMRISGSGRGGYTYSTPSYVPLPPEQVAATLPPPLLDERDSQDSIKMSKEMPMEVDSSGSDSKDSKPPTMMQTNPTLQTKGNDMPNLTSMITKPTPTITSSPKTPPNNSPMAAALKTATAIWKQQQQQHQLVKHNLQVSPPRNTMNMSPQRVPNLSPPRVQNLSPPRVPNLSPHHVQTLSPPRVTAVLTNISPPAGLTTPPGGNMFIPATTTVLYGSPPVKHDSSPAHYVQSAFTHYIPRILPGDTSEDNLRLSSSRPYTPELWTSNDVCQFLQKNECGAYSDSFSKRGIDGHKFLTLSKEQIVNLTGMKVGPSLKIFDLIQSLKIKVKEQSRAKVSLKPSRT